jgi:hypothetical protein
MKAGGLPRKRRRVLRGRGAPARRFDRALFGGRASSDSRPGTIARRSKSDPAPSWGETSPRTRGGVELPRLLEDESAHRCPESVGAQRRAVPTSGGRSRPLAKSHMPWRSPSCSRTGGTASHSSRAAPAEGSERRRRTLELPGSNDSHQAEDEHAQGGDAQAQRMGATQARTCCRRAGAQCPASAQSSTMARLRSERTNVLRKKSWARSTILRWMRCRRTCRA